MTGTFFAFEGIDGSGKSSQIQALCKKLPEAIATAQPSQGAMGQLLRSYLQVQQSADPRAIALLFAADRLDHITREDGLQQQMARGKTILCDRYYFSSFAYQSLDLPMEEVIACNKMARELLRPTATFFLDVPVDVALYRIKQRGGKQELFESKQRLQQTYENYQKAFGQFQEEEKIYLIDAARPQQEITEELLSLILSFQPNVYGLSHQE